MKLPLWKTDAKHRVTCIDRVYFDENGYIKPAKITVTGVESQSIRLIWQKYGGE